MRRFHRLLAVTGLVLGLGALARPATAHAQFTLQRTSSVVQRDSASHRLLQAMRQDYTRILVKQEDYFLAHRRYAPDLAALGEVMQTSGATITFTAGADWWVAASTHRDLPGTIELAMVRRAPPQPAPAGAAAPEPRDQGAARERR
jgi:hypothetical protein